MDEATGDMVHGSMSGVMTTGASLVAAQVGNGLYTDGQTGHINYGNHYTECYHIPDMCVQGVTFAMWIKRGDGAGSGIVLYTNHPITMRQLLSSSIYARFLIPHVENTGLHILKCNVPNKENILPAVNIGWYLIFDSVDTEPFQTLNHKHVAKVWYCHAKCG